MKKRPDAQREHWETTFAENPDLFGAGPSEAGRLAADLLRAENRTGVLEFGGGQGRDALFFARNGLHVRVLDYSERAVEAITAKARGLPLSGSVDALRHDLRDPLPFADESFDACYSHMLFCMALTTAELERAFREARRVLRPKGLHIFTVRTTQDPHYGAGISRGEDMYEVDGFVVHFFSREQVARLAAGDEIVRFFEFEEGDLPRRLFFVAARKGGIPGMTG
jgi:SAM-dependent methyltransferase